MEERAGLWKGWLYIAFLFFVVIKKPNFLFPGHGYFFAKKSL